MRKSKEARKSRTIKGNQRNQGKSREIEGNRGKFGKSRKSREIKEIPV